MTDIELTLDPARMTDRQHGRRGQVAVIFAGAMLLFVLLAATVIDLSWYWTNNLRIQRAADAAALAGVVFLPGDTTNAYAAARVESAKNGYTHGVGGFVVTPLQDPANERRLLVTISGPVNTFFARAVGISTWPAQRTAKADFVLPVPMGSPENYYGVGYLIEPVTTTTTTTTNGTGNSGQQHPGSSPAGTWLSSSGTIVSAVSSASGDTNHAYTTTAGATQQFGTLNLLSGLAANQNITAVTGIQVFLNDTRMSATCNNSRVRVHLSWDGGRELDDGHDRDAQSRHEHHQRRLHARKPDEPDCVDSRRDMGGVRPGQWQLRRPPDVDGGRQLRQHDRDAGRRGHGPRLLQPPDGHDDDHDDPAADERHRAGRARR